MFGFMKDYQIKKIKKIMECPSIKYVIISYGDGFYKKKNYYTFID
jgi:hypothetical protein